MKKESFINSGRFVPAEKFIKDRPSEMLHIDCTDVVVYDDGHYIQALKTGLFFYEGFINKKLEEVEEHMWKTLYNN